MRHRQVWVRLLGAAACVFVVAACSEEEQRRSKRDDNDDDAGGAGVGGSAGQGGSAQGGFGGEPTAAGGNGAGGEAMVCEPGSAASCYSGDPDTQGVGVCVPGEQICFPDGSGYAACVGEVLPTDETCATPGDDDCDGETNEEGAGCNCAPGSIASCYSGPPPTENVGICQSGQQTCNNQGTGYGPCTGEVLPQAENCMTSADEDCDGQTPPCPAAIVDLRADNNRNGTIDLADPTEDNSESTWSASHGAIFLANIDDDQSACPTSGTDAQLAACNDAADAVTNGTNDLIDLARLKTVPWPAAPNNSSGTLTVSAPGSTYVRLFKKNGNTFSAYTPGSNLTPAELQAGVEFAIEGKDFVRSTNVWNGYVDLTFTVNGGNVMGGSDVVRMRVAPVIFRHHLHPATEYYVTNINSQSSQDFRDDLATAAGAAGVPGTDFFVSDQWTQDFFETAYMSMPSNGGQHVIHVNFRSANYTGSLRTAGRVVFTDLRGPNVAGAVEYDPNHPNGMDTLNSFGNLETIPPYTHQNQSWPDGRVLRGSTPGFYPDEDFDEMVASQNVQGIVYIDTEWLLVAHVDETVSFIKANTPRGWVLLWNDANLAKTMLQTQQGNGYGSTSMFVGKFWQGNVSAQVTINQVLADTDVMNESAWAVVKVNDQKNVLIAQTGLTAQEMVPIPFLHMQSSGYSVAFQPGTVNGIYLSNTVFGVPDPHGPTINGADPFQTQLVNVLAPFGVVPHWIEDWNLYHRLLGEVHCGSNVTRAVPANDVWWDSGL
jgi:protein-arginine deiminase